MNIIGHQFVDWKNLKESAEIDSLCVYLNLLLPQLAVVMKETVVHELEALLELHF
jgi:hypothetical protein